MTSCPPTRELKRLLAKELSQSDSETLQMHVETCLFCRALLARLTDDPATAVSDPDLDLASSPRTDFLQRLKVHRPSDVAPVHEEAEEATGATEIRFPGPPTDKGPLGQLDSYHIKKELGSGAFAFVYQAVDALDRLVAIKVLKPEFAASGQQRTRFEREVRTAAAVKHDHIVTIHQVGNTPGFPLPYFVMEFVEGESLADLIDREGTLEPSEAVRIVLQVAMGLRAAHQQGLVHRDIKPANILIERDTGRAKVADFGLARSVEAGRERITQTGHIAGTPSYMSPEQIMAPEQLDGRSDVYSLGVVLYELVTGHQLFRGATQMVLKQVIHQEPRPPRLLNEQVPRELETITLKCMAKEPARRYQTAAELIEDLQRFQSNRPIMARPVGNIEKFSRWCRRNPVVAGLTAAVAVLMLTGTAVSTFFAIEANRRAAVIKEEKDRADSKTQEAEDNARKFADERDRADKEARDARSEKKRADESAAEAKANAQKAAENERTAKQREADAKAAAVSEKAAKDQLLEAQRNAARRAYPINVLLAQQAWESNRIGRLRDILEDQRALASVFLSSPVGPAQPSDAKPTDLRGFEWYYWNRLCHSALQSFADHKDVVTSVAFSPDGKLLVSASGDKTVRIRDAATGKEKRTLRDHGGPVNCVAFSSDGKWLATGGDDKKLRVWDTDTGQEAVPAMSHNHEITWLAFTPKGERLYASTSEAGSGQSGELKIWNPTNGQELHSSPDAPNICFALSSEGGRLVTVSSGGEAKEWNADTFAPMRDLKGHRGRVVCVAYSPDSARLATASDDGTVVLWHPNDKSQEPLRGHIGSVTCIAFSPDSKRLASGSTDQTVKVWDVETGQEIFSLKGHLDSVTSVAFTPDGSRLASASWDGTVKMWDASNQPGIHILTKHTAPVVSVAFSADGKRLASGGQDDKAILWNAASQLPEHVLSDHTAEVTCVALNPDGSRLATASSDMTVKIWNTADGQVTHTLKAHQAIVTSVAFSPDGRRLASASVDRAARVWDLANGQVVHTLSSHAGDVTSVAFSPDGQWLASGSDDKAIKVWNAQTGQEVRTYQGHKDRITCVAFSRNGRWLASCSADLRNIGGKAGRIVIWDTATHKIAHEIGAHNGGVANLSFSSDSRRLASGSYDRTVKVWDVESGLEMITLKGHKEGVTSVAFSTDGYRLVSASLDGTLRIWDATPMETVPEQKRSP